MAEFIEVYVKATGHKQIIPAHFLTIPSIARNFTKTPRQRTREAEMRRPVAQTRGTTFRNRRPDSRGEGE